MGVLPLRKRKENLGVLLSIMVDLEPLRLSLMAWESPPGHLHILTAQIHTIVNMSPLREPGQVITEFKSTATSIELIFYRPSQIPQKYSLQHRPATRIRK